MGRKKHRRSNPSITATTSVASIVSEIMKSPSKVSRPVTDFTDEGIKAIAMKCGKAIDLLRQGCQVYALRVIRKVVKMHGKYGFVQRYKASIFLILSDKYNETVLNNEYLLEGLESAKKAVQLEPNCIEHTVFFAMNFLELAKTVDDYNALIQLCEIALALEDPVDYPMCFDTVDCDDSSEVSRRISAVQEELKRIIQHIKYRVAKAVLLEQETDSTTMDVGEAIKDCWSRLGVPVVKSVDKEIALNEELRQNEKNKEAEQKTSSTTSYEIDESSQKHGYISASVPGVEPADQLIQNEPRKNVELVDEAAEQEHMTTSFKHEACESLQKHVNNTSDKDLAVEPADQLSQNEPRINVKLGDEAAEQERMTSSSKHEACESLQQDANTSEKDLAVEPAAGRKKSLDKGVKDQITNDELRKNEELTEANEASGSSQIKHGNIRMVPKHNWLPTDDGINFSIPGNPSASREEAIQYINQLIYDSSPQKPRLPVFRAIWSPPANE